MPLEQELMDLEMKFWTDGPDAYLRHADRQCLVVFRERAGLMTKEEIARSAERGRWSDVRSRPKGLVMLSDDSAVISYECTATRKDGAHHRARVSSGYRNGSDGWKLAFHQQTPLE